MNRLLAAGRPITNFGNNVRLFHCLSIPSYTHMFLDTCVHVSDMTFFISTIYNFARI